MASSSREARAARTAALAFAAVAALALLAPRGARAQQDSGAYLQGQELESQDRYADAAAAYRQALAQQPTNVPAMLGLERVYAMLGRSDSLLPVLDTAIARAPTVAEFRAAQLRTLRSLGERGRMRAAFDAWRRDVPRDPTPYRTYARMLIDDGFTASADSVLREGEGVAGLGARGFAYELAQLHAATGEWVASARAWRQALRVDPVLGEAAVFSLTAVPDSARGAVRTALLAPPAVASALVALGSLEIAWGSAAAGWDAIRALPPDSAVVAAWIAFSARAEQADAWLPARDALLAAGSVRRDPSLVARAASDALAGGDAADAAALAARAEAGMDSATAAATVVGTHLRALASLGKPDDAQHVLDAYAAHLDAGQRAAFARVLAWGWVQRGDLDRARALLAQAGGGEDAAQGWIALYGGDLATARRLLRPGTEASPALLTALSLLQRTTADSSPSVGRAFLTLARGDTLAAAAAFDSAAAAMPDIASLLRFTAGRLFAERGDVPHAITAWSDVVEHMPNAPEAPAAELEWARALRREGQHAAAVKRLEHLILTYPQSALVPQARRELELARAAVPSTS